MPQVPQYERRVQTGALPTARTSTGVAQEAFTPFAPAFDAATKLFAEEKQKADDVATTEAFTKLVKRRNQLSFDPKTGAMTRRGKDAFGVVDEFGPEFDKAADEIAEELNTAEQRAMFSKIRQRERAEFDSQLQKHLAAETVRYDEETTKASLETTREDAILNAHDAKKVQEIVGMQGTLLTGYAQRTGKDAEWLKGALRDEGSKTHRGVIDRLLAQGQDIRAKEYFDAYKGGLSGSDISAVEKDLEEGSLRGKSQRMVDQIMTEKGDWKERLKLATERTKEDPKLRQAVEERLTAQMRLQDSFDQKARQDNYLRATNIVDKIKGTGKLAKDAVPQAIWRTLGREERSALENYAADNDVPDNSAKYYELTTLGANAATRENFKRMYLPEFASKVSRGDMARLIDLQTKIRMGDEKTLQHLDGVQTHSSIMENAIQSIYSPNQRKMPEFEGLAAKFRARVDQEVIDIQNKSGKKITNLELQEITDRLAADIVVSEGWIFDDTKRVFNITIQDVPAADRAEIEKALRQINRPVTERNIVELFVKKQGKRGN